ncbi:hypothetical protein BDV96DRAFT_602764 [Lophiotrema nucula]|uniref:Uncharacterized protein n=1 Tax=Lophiotrema nucula TaxID=690887 RepID=A0A6A5YX37_9PLEO|nr:hypothetical protein BDV96DRAFT_602764 [Lophiotrema nucula]
MAHIAHTRSAVAEISGKRLHDHKLVYDTPVSTRISDQRSSPDDTAQKSTSHPGGRGSGQSASEDATNEDDEDEDSSANKDDENEDDEDDPEVLAPSHGHGLGKGKCPAIRVEHLDDDESHKEEEEAASHGAGLLVGKHLVDQALMLNKKRTFSNVSNTSVLFGEDDSENNGFPRSKMAKRLSSNSAKPLMTYKNSKNGDAMTSFENALESSDEDNDANIDDEDYSGVNLISDDSDIEREEEDFMVTQALHRQFDFVNTHRRQRSDTAASDDFFTFNGLAEGGLLTPSTVPDIGFGQFFEPAPPPVPAPATPEPITNRKYSNGSSKRVRFDDEVQVSDSSSSSASDLDSSLWPDLFMEQDKLPASIYHMIENDNDTDNVDNLSSSGSEHSYWDFGQDESRTQYLPTVEEEVDDDSSDAGSSGYETDMGGDTTDEYDSDFEFEAPSQTPRQKSTVLRRPSSAPGSKAASPVPFQRSRSSGKGRVMNPPLRGIFVHEETSEAIAVTNRATKTLTFYRPRAPLTLRQPNYGAYSSTTSTANNSPCTSVQHLNGSDSEMSQDVFINPFQNSDIMLTGIFGTAPASTYLFSGETIGPPEAFFPFIDIAPDGNMFIDEEDEEEDDDDEDYEDDLNITDFMDFGDGTDAEDDETDVPATPATSMVAFPGSTPAQQMPLAETPSQYRGTDAMLEHFDRGVVTAFRNHQNRYRDTASLPHDPDLRASVSRPVRSGKSAEQLMSPLRKRGSAPKKTRSQLGGVTKATGRLQSSVMGSRRGPPMGTFS